MPPKFFWPYTRDLLLHSAWMIFCRSPFLHAWSFGSRLTSPMPLGGWVGHMTQLSQWKSGRLVFMHTWLKWSWWNLTKGPCSCAGFGAIGGYSHLQLGKSPSKNEREMKEWTRKWSWLKSELSLDFSVKWANKCSFSLKFVPVEFLVLFVL